MGNFVKKTKKTAIDSNREYTKKSEPKSALKNNPNLLIEDQKIAELEIQRIQKNLKNQKDELMPFVNRLFSCITDIAEETHFCAVYLSLSQVMLYWDSIFLLTENGYSSTIQLVIRPIKEHLALTELFTFEFKEKKNKYLKEWFSGEIIHHGAYRNMVKKFFGEDGGEKMKEIANDIYRIESLAVHASYPTILENISPFTENFDHGKHTRFKRTLYNLDYIREVMTTTNGALQHVYLYILEDHESFNQLDRILNKYKK